LFVRIVENLHKTNFWFVLVSFSSVSEDKIFFR